MSSFHPLVVPWSDSSIYVPLAIVALVASILYAVITKERPIAGFPLISVKHNAFMGATLSWAFKAKEIVAKGLKETNGGFQIMTGTGPKIILPNRYADELRNHPSLNFNKAFAKDFFVDYPGFEGQRQGLKDGTLIQETVRVKLTQSLNLVTEDLVDETTCSLHDIFGESEDWQTIRLKDGILDLVARLSSRVFLGMPLCRNNEWLQIAKEYTVDTFIAANELRLVPALVRPIVYWLMPRCRNLRRQIRAAHKLIMPEVERRKQRVDKARESGLKPPKIADTIGWMYEISRGREIDYVGGQLALTLAAIHTTTETTVQVMMDLCQYPEYIEPLREEIIKVLSDHGWAKTSLYKMKLMDSLLKESQRINAMSTTSMNRFIESDIELSDGTVLPQGARMMVSADTYMSPDLYPEPTKFDPYRFLRLRQQPGQENNHQFVTASAEHMVFGHGQHACPGRFFASNEVKIALCQMLLKYDWKFIDGQGRPENLSFETATSANPNATVQIRRRREEITL